jgi:hypothetical protein
MVGLSKEPPTTTTTEIRVRPTEVSRSPRDEETSSVGIVRKIITILIIIGSCRTRRKEMVPSNLRINPMVMVRLLLFPDGDSLAVFAACVSQDNEWILILLLRLIFAVTKTCSFRMSLCSLEILFAWEMILRVRLRALAPFRSRHMMG